MKKGIVTAAALAAAASIAVPAAAQLRVTKRADLSAPVKLEPGQGAILVAFRRPDSMSMGKSGALSFARYDVEKRDLIFQPKGAKKSGDKTTYWVDVDSADKKLAVEYHLMPVSEGDYVLFGAAPGPAKQVTNTFCLGAPTFRVGAGEVVYFGDVTPYIGVELADGGKAMAMAYSANADEARKALGNQPALAPALRPADVRNEATYSCAGQEMLAYAVPGAASLPPAPREGATARR
ncbi:MAG TPA: hypothetical protein VGR19_08255 [Allosphingosinicella sp.]|nr:hypothetical protein [Allosphingosinicella sp.]